jgi:hypothetical protein
MIQSPAGFVIIEECNKAAWQNGYRREMGELDGWVRYASTTVHGTIHLAAAGPQGPWFLALDHCGVIEELDLVTAGIPGPGISRYVFDDLGGLYATLPRVYQLAASLPDAPLQEFLAKVKGLPQTTEVERLVVQRVGQDIFRASLMDYWQARCPLTGITDLALLRASHIVPWKDCENNEERLNVHNGLLLSALWDAAFDKGLVTFENDGSPRFAPCLSESARAALLWSKPISLTASHRSRLDWHRQNVFRPNRETVETKNS